MSSESGDNSQTEEGGEEKMAASVPAPASVIESALLKARGSVLADAELVDILAKRIVVLKPDADAIDAALKAIENLAEKRATTPPDRAAEREDRSA